MKFSFLSLSIFVLTLCSFLRCAPVYVPTTHNTPLFSGKGEFQTSVSIGTGANAQAAYAISDHIGLSANYLYLRNEESQRGRKHQAADIGLGYYNNVNEQWCIEIFGGYGFGKGRAYDSLYVFPFSDDQYEVNGKYTKIFIQPSIGLRKDNVTYYLSARFSYVNFSEINLRKKGEEVDVTDKSTTYFSFVHGTRVPLIKEKLFFQYQGGFNVSTERTPEYDFNFFSGSVGLAFIPNRAKRQ